jgi:hypothetical protein
MFATMLLRMTWAMCTSAVDVLDGTEDASSYDTRND